MNLAADDPEGQARLTAFVQGLQELGWTDGRNVQLDYRWPAGDAERIRRYVGYFPRGASVGHCAKTFISFPSVELHRAIRGLSPIRVSAGELMSSSHA
jgi:hypothetical protein